MPIYDSLLQVIQPLKELFLQDEFDDIPDFRFKPNSDFSLISSNVASLAITTEPSADEPAQVAAIFDSIAEYVQDDRNVVRLETIEHTAKSFAVILENSYSSLNNELAPAVDLIKTMVDKRYIELMTRSKAEGLIADAAVIPSEDDYTILDWGSLAAPAVANSVIDIACANAGISTPALSMLNMSYITKKLWANGFTNLNIPTEVEAVIISKLATHHPDISSETVKQFFSIITDENVYKSICFGLTQKFADNRNAAINCMDLIQYTEAFDTLSNSVQGLIEGDLSTETKNVIAANVETVNKTMTAARYWILVMKNIRFAGKLILTDTVLNGPVYEEFVSSGHTITDIHNHLKAFHLDVSMPSDGISLEKVLTSDHAEQLEKAALKLKSNATFIKSKCLISAYEDAVVKFLNDESIRVTYPKVLDKSFANQFIKVAINKASALGGDIARLDSVLYDLIISSFYADSLIATLYKYLGQNFDDLADSSTDEITDAQINLAQCTAICDMLIDYLFSMVVGDVDQISSAQECLY